MGGKLPFGNPYISTQTYLMKTLCFHVRDASASNESETDSERELLAGGVDPEELDDSFYSRQHMPGVGA